jgi:RNA polymerase sigma-70 factor (ECF subfamily)
LVLSTFVDLAHDRLGRLDFPLAGHLKRGLPDGKHTHLKWSLRSCNMLAAEADEPIARKNWIEMTSVTIQKPGSRDYSPKKNPNRCCPRKPRRHIAQVTRMLYLRPLGLAETSLQFRAFDARYIENLCAGDQVTQEHFVGYFTELLQLKLRSRLQSPQAIEDVRQETFARVLATLRRENALRRPESFGAFVNTVCNNVLLEHYRSSSRSQSLDEEGIPEPQATGADVVSMIAATQLKTKVREILLELPLRDRSLLKAVFLEERDREDVCREFGVDREYLRVLLHRAKQEFKVEYLKRMNIGMSARPAETI